VRATPRAGAVRLTWAPPLSNRGAAITDYVIQRARSRTGPWRTVRDGVSTARAVRVTGLVAGTRPFFRVAARNAAGTGPFSAVARASAPVWPG
jgi:Fibronectin type III domain